MKIKNLDNKIIIILIILIVIFITIIIINKKKNKETFIDLPDNILLGNLNQFIDTVYVRENIKSDEIPLNIFMCWNTKDLPPKMKKNIDKIKKENPEFNVYVFDDKECRNMIEKYFVKDVLNAFDSLIPGAYKADLWRYCALYLYGGIYQDIKLEPINDFRYKELIDKEYFVKDRVEGQSGIYNALLVCKKNNKILEIAIKQIIKNCKEKYYGLNALYPTGPLLLKKYFSQYDFDNLELHFFGNIYDPTDNNIMFKNKKIFKMYDGYRDEQNKFGNKHYNMLWIDKKIYKL